jgi:tRNA C32,U32 (ribose-2'-O)-methylase TrmJ
MPAPIDEIIKRRVVQQWLAGDSRSKIAIDNNIGEGTVYSIVNNFKVGLDNSEFNSARELALLAKKQGLTPVNLASSVRLNNYIVKSGAAEDKIESFIDNISSSNLPPEKVIELVNQLHYISKSEPIPIDQVSGYINKKLEEKQKIDEEIKQADAALQNKNVTFEAISEHLKLKEELDRHGVSMQDIDKLLKLLSNAKRYAFDGKEIADKLYNMLELEWKEKELKNKCKKLSRRISKYKDAVYIIPCSLNAFLQALNSFHTTFILSLINHSQL